MTDYNNLTKVVNPNTQISGPPQYKMTENRKKTALASVLNPNISTSTNTDKMKVLLYYPWISSWITSYIVVFMYAMVNIDTHELSDWSTWTIPRDTLLFHVHFLMGVYDHVFWKRAWRGDLYVDSKEMAMYGAIVRATTYVDLVTLIRHSFFLKDADPATKWNWVQLAMLIALFVFTSAKDLFVVRRSRYSTKLVTESHDTL